MTDGILSECLVFYWGAPNISEYYEDSVIFLDLSSHEKAEKQIRNAIKNKEWEKRIDSIKRIKNKILTDLYFDKRVTDIIEKHLKFSLSNEIIPKPQL